MKMLIPIHHLVWVVAHLPKNFLKRTPEPILSKIPDFLVNNQLTNRAKVKFPNLS
jgi:hypothetical protein